MERMVFIISKTFGLSLPELFEFDPEIMVWDLDPSYLRLVFLALKCNETAHGREYRHQFWHIDIQLLNEIEIEDATNENNLR